MADDVQRRVKALNDAAPRQDGAYVLYWMEHSQRADANPALERAVAWANELKLPLLVAFVVDPAYPDGSARHFTFMLEGLKETMDAVKRRGAHFALRKGNPADVVAGLGRHAAALVTDRGYLTHLKSWRSQVAADCGCLMEMVEGDVIVPVEEVSDKMETAARTIRPKLHKTMKGFVELPSTTKLKTKADRLGSADDVALDDVSAFVRDLDCDHDVAPVDWLKGGPKQAEQRLREFVSSDLPNYADGRSDIVNRHVSTLSPYLHLGQISPLTVYHAVKDAKVSQDDADAYIEELVVRRELAVNYVHYNTDYDKYKALPGWALETLKDHADDDREETYTRKQLEDGKTDDPYWNAAMREMRLTGYLHNYMRMYWGKRIIGWTKNPKTAYATTIYLNNKYFLDGRDANSFTNVSWLFGLHDRGWPEREVYGKVRVMKPSGLKRKFDVDAYVRWAESL